jgi:3-isopropylmalate/(R)-2-methylmalate dehydratase small subunit
MQSFTRVTAVGAPLAKSNVDTEVIIPITRLIEFKRGELGPYAFEPWRYAADGAPQPDFVLNKPKYAGAQILVTGANFGCGSSREAAVWALWDLGLRCVIAESFGDIFRANCFQNGLLPITLAAEAVLQLQREIANADSPMMSVDLWQSNIVTPTGRILSFGIDPERRVALLEGLDETGITLKSLPDIQEFQERDRLERPWVYQPLGGH